MIDIGNVVTPSPEQFMFALRSMRNPLNSWDKQDSYVDDGGLVLGDEDYKLAMKLARNGSEHRKYLRSLPVMMDITAPLYWWKEFDTYKIGTVSNSCSTMHKIHAKELTREDFSWEHLTPRTTFILEGLLEALNEYREWFLTSKDKYDWWQLIQALPSSYNQRRSITTNYETLSHIYESRKNHKLDEWRDFCTFMDDLECSFLITTGKEI